MEAHRHPFGLGRVFFYAGVYTALMQTEFEALIGHATISRILASSVQRPAPAYLFLGPAHLGKRTFAEGFIETLLDRHNDRRATLSSHPDFILLEPEEGKKQVSVEQVRGLRERVSMRPLLAPRVVAFIPFADRLNESGTNALLKVLEEPPADAVFVLVAEDLGKLPATVLSRSVVLRFGPVPEQEIISGLRARGVSQKEAAARGVAARGRPGLALDPPEGDDPGAQFACAFLLAKTCGARLTRIEEITNACESAEDANAAWRDVLQSAMQSASPLLHNQPVEASLFGIGLLQALRFVGTAVSPRIALEAVALRLGTAPRIELQRLFPTPVPRALPLIYGSLVQ